MSQPGVSKTVKAFENELGTPVFVRASGRIIGLTEFGQDILGFVRGILHYSAAVLERAYDKKQESRETLRVGTNRIYSRYSLPQVIHKYKKRFSGACVHVHQGDPEQVAQWIGTGRVEVGISTMMSEAAVGLFAVPVLSVEHCIITPKEHELLTTKKPSLADIAKYPLVSFHEVHSPGEQSHGLLIERGINESVVLDEATDPDVVKAYVRAGLGIAIVQKICVNGDANGLGVIDASHLFPPVIAYLILRRDRHLRSSAHDFIDLFTPRWSKHELEQEFQKQAHVKRMSALH